MKNNQLIKTIAVTLFSVCLWANVQAQGPTGVCTVIQQPCNGNGKLAVNITSGLTPPLTFTYYDNNYQATTHSNVNSLNDTLSAISTSILYLYVSDGAGNNFYAESLNIGMHAPFQVDQAIITNAVCPNPNGTAQITINGGTAPTSVQWYSYINNMQGPPAGTSNPMSLPAGTYLALLTDASGCTVLAGYDSSGAGPIIIQSLSSIAFSVSSTSPNCTNGTATVSNPTGGVAPYTYQWSNGANAQSINNLSEGAYTVIVTDAQGCNHTDYAYLQQAITINVNTTPTPATCLQTDGSVISFGSGGTPPYTYIYSNGMAGQTASGLSGGAFLTVAVTDAHGCTGTGYVSINTSTPITATYTATNSSCTAPTGSATLIINGGVAPYTINWSTFPAQSGTSIHNMAAGSYEFTVTDAAGCVQTGAAVIPPQSILSAYASSSNPVCPATTGSVSVSASGSNPPFTYLWNTNATGASIANAPLGSYSCVITDHVGCSVTKSAYLTTSSPINVGLNATSASCIYTSDGSIYAHAFGGTAPYTYSWSNGQNTSNITGLATGNYYAYVQDANGCTQEKHTFVGYNASNTSCYCTITGKVYVDLNNNCVFNSGEQGVEHIMIHCAGFGYTFTDANGNYSFAVPTGSYTLSESVQATYPLATCQNNAIAVSVTAAAGCSSTVNFANTTVTIHDIHIVGTSINNPIPGNAYTQGLIVQNDGTVNESNIQLGKKHDGQLQFTSTSPNVYTQLSPIPNPDWYSVASGFPALAPGASAMIYTDYSVPTNIPLGTAVNFWDSAVYAAPMTNWLNDYTPWNNVNNYDATVIGSFDPNFKEVTPKGTGTQGYITTSDSVLNYVIHFQNTGSSYAQKIVVIDSLDTNLDWSSLKPGYSDHQYIASVSENGVLKFTFNNINLDWQSRNELDSRGLISYSIKQRPHLSPGTKIKNTADIYFDYNAPVITNQTLNTIQLPAGVSEIQSNYGISIYPNPATNELNIDLSNAGNVSVISIYDLQGRLLQNEKVANNTTLHKVNVSSLANGLYFVELENNDGHKMTGKFMKN